MRHFTSSRATKRSLTILARNKTQDGILKYSTPEKRSDNVALHLIAQPPQVAADAAAEAKLKAQQAAAAAPAPAPKPLATEAAAPAETKGSEEDD